MIVACGSARGAVISHQVISGVSAMTGKNLAANITFSTSGSTLTLVVTNTGDAAEAPADALTGVFWNLSTGPALSPQSVNFTTPNGANKDVLLNPAGGDVLGAEWALGDFAAHPVYGIDRYGVIGAGFGLLGTGNFASPGDMLDGVGYGIVNGLGPNANGGINNRPLVSKSLTFTLGGISGNPAVSGVHVQYGTALTEPTVPNDLPEPTLVAPLFLGALLGARRRRSPSPSRMVNVTARSGRTAGSSRLAGSE